MSPSKRCHCRGMALVYTAITCMALMAILGLALDTARVLLVANELQSAADASALAGAAWVHTDGVQARSAALGVCAANTAEGVSIQLADNPDNSPAGDVVLGVYDRTTGIFTPTRTSPFRSPNAVMVTARRTADQNGSLPLIFGPIFGTSTSDIARVSIAMVAPSTGGIIILDPSGPDSLLDTATGGNLTITGGTIWINNNFSPTAVDLTGSGSIVADSLNIAAGGGYSVTGAGSLPANIELNVSPVEDPYAPLRPPPQGDAGVQSGNTFSPGYYPSGIHLSNTADNPVIFQPGIYYIDGDGLSITGSGSVTGDGVLFYIGDSGAFNITGSGPVTLSPMTLGSWTGVTIYQSRFSAAQSQITGSGGLNISGAIYVPDARVIFSGSGQFGNSVVVKYLTLTGSGNMTVPYSGAENSGTPFLVQ